MLTLERQQYIIEHLKKNKAASVAGLAKMFFIGEATIRRDLDKLEKSNLVRRTYGGAVLTEGLHTEIPISVREKEQTAAKSLIGRAAAEFVENGDILIIDSSTTTHAIIPHLKAANITIITNGLKTADEVGRELHIPVFCTGGKLRENSSSLVGSGAMDYLRDFSVKKLFFSCRAAAAGFGAMDNSEEEAILRRAMMERAEQSFLLCDSSKLEQKAFYRICGFESIDYIITNEQPPERLTEHLLASGTELIVAK